jgi:predicted nucleotidyltransferase
MDIKRCILEKLDETERVNDVKIILAVESGSRGWGFASQNSDYDARFIYVRKLDWYLSVDVGKDFIGFDPDPVFDMQGWDIRKALGLLKRSNASIFEWLSSPVRYKANLELTELLKGFAEIYFDKAKCLQHYISIARNSLKLIESSEMAKLKKYFYCLRPLACCQYIIEKEKIPPMEYAKVLADVKMDSGIADEISKLLDMKKATNEDLLIVRNQILIGYMKSLLEELEKEVEKRRRDPKKDSAVLDEFFRKAIDVAWKD